MFLQILVFWFCTCICSAQLNQELENKLQQLEQETLPELLLEKDVLVPRIVFQIWLGITSPSPDLQFAHSCYHLNPTYKFVLFDAALAEYFLKTRLPPDMKNLKETYDKLTNYGEKSDLLRYLLLYTYGGIYTDLDVQCLQSFDGNEKNQLQNLRNISNLVIPWEGDFPVNMKSGVPIAKIRQASQFILFASGGGHPVLKAALNEVQKTQKLQDSDFLDVLYRTGPGMLTDIALKNGYNNNNNNDDNDSNNNQWSVSFMPIVSFNQKMGFGLPGFSPLAYATHTTAFHKWTKSGDFSYQNISRPEQMYLTPSIFKSKKYNAQPVWIGDGSLLVPLIGQLKTSYKRDVGQTLIKYGFWPVYHDSGSATGSLIVQFLLQYSNNNDMYNNINNNNNNIMYKELVALGGDAAGYLPIKMALKGWSTKVYLGKNQTQLANLIRKSAQINSISNLVEVKVLKDSSIKESLAESKKIPVVHFGELLSDIDDIDKAKQFVVNFFQEYSPNIIIAEINPQIQNNLIPLLLNGAIKQGYQILHAGFGCEKRSVFGLIGEELPIPPVNLVVAGQRICSIDETSIQAIAAETMVPEIFLLIKQIM